MKFGFTGLKFKMVIALSLLFALNGSPAGAIPCDEGTVSVFDGTEIVTESSEFMNEIGACNIARETAENRVFTEVSRLRDELCIYDKGDVYLTGTLNTSHCGCSSTPGTSRCSAQASQEYVCCKQMK